ncbi:hypothetical protein HY489_00875 [Candidatus Woesearchaeota archaeon]|nr:hypothetical protein [Candidatus Woesearchaeota archaeon]
MALIIVFDTSTLILLAKTTMLRLLSTKMTIQITQEVWNEATTKDTDDARIIRQLHDEGGIIISSTESVNLKDIMLDFNMDHGEASAVLFAKKTQAVLATDDRQAIKACKVLGIQFTTALNILIKVFEKKWISKDQTSIKLRGLLKYARYSEEIAKTAQKIIGGHHE